MPQLLIDQQQLEQMFKEGIRCSEIAKVFEISRQTVWQWYKKSAYYKPRYKKERKYEHQSEGYPYWRCPIRQHQQRLDFWPLEEPRKMATIKCEYCSKGQK